MQVVRIDATCSVMDRAVQVYQESIFDIFVDHPRPAESRKKMQDPALYHCYEVVVLDQIGIWERLKVV